MKLKLLKLLLLSLLLSVLCSSCAVLSKSQLKSIENLAVLGDKMNAAPRILVEDLAAVRKERGVFYAISLSTTDLHLDELESLAQAYSEDLKMAKKFDLGVEVMESYVRTLYSLSHENRWKEYGTEIRGFGRNLSEAIEQINELDISDKEYPSELSKNTVYSLASFSESYMRRRQTKILRDFITQGDTLVASTVDFMVDLLKSENLSSLIKNEKEGLRINYSSYLNSPNTSTDVYLMDKQYLSLLEQIEKIELIRRRCISSLQAFKRAHNKIVKGLERRQDIEQVYDELIEYALEVNKILELI